jgi:hypothetical protein
MTKFQLLLERIKSSSISANEVLCRKYLAEIPNDLRVWNLLFDILIYTKNNNEVLLLVASLLKRSFFNHSCLLMCIKYLLLAGDYDFARKLFSRIDFENAEKNISFKNDLYHLALLEKLQSGEDTLALKLDVMNPVAAKFNKKTLEQNKSNSVQVVCYLIRDFHYVIQAQIASELLKNGINVFFSNSLWFIKAVKPKVLLLSEALYGNLIEIRNSNPNTLIVNTRHGLGDKNHAALGASQSDRICVSSKSIAELMINEVLTPQHKIWVTGYPQMDSLFDNLKKNPHKISKTLSKTVIFAPTFTPSLSAAYLLKTDLVKSIRGDDENIRIIVKPHPHLFRDDPEIISNWLKESETHHNVYVDIDSNSNIVDYFHQCDLMISDVSSAALAWFSVNKPLICLIDRNVAETSENFSADGIEWKMHEAATVVSKSCDLSEMVNNALSNPQIKLEERRKFSNYLFGDLKDGKSSYRIAMKIMEYLQK